MHREIQCLVLVSAVYSLSKIWRLYFFTGTTMASGGCAPACLCPEHVVGGSFCRWTQSQTQIRRVWKSPGLVVGPAGSLSTPGQNIKLVMVLECEKGKDPNYKR